jgi:RNA polymerase sigma factor (sigma-70 family)
MATAQMNLFLRRLTRGMAAETVGELTDRQLLERLLAAHDEAVFEALVRRHGPMVYRVCWRVLQQPEDAEDAFQATFLLLARKVQTVRKLDSLASWLHGVAHRVALDAKAQAARRRQHKARVAANSHAGPPEEITWRELRAVLDSELGRLPEKLRLPLILCYLEGRSQEEAATQLGWSKSTLLRRLEEARAVLGRRLNRRGVVWPAALSAVLLSDCVAPAAQAPGLVGSTVEAAACLATGKAALRVVVSANVAALIERMLPTMSFSKPKLAIGAFVLALGVGLAVGGWAMAQPTPPTPPTPPEKSGQVEPQPDAAQEPPPAPAGPKAVAVLPEGRKFLNSPWLPSAEYSDGTKLPAARLAGQLFEFKGSLCTMTNGGMIHKWVYKVDPAKTPKEIDFTPLNVEDFPPGGAKVLKAIYAFDGDNQLTISWLPESDQKRPTTFEGKPGSGQWVVQLKRGKYTAAAWLATEPVFVNVKPAANADEDDAERKLVKARFNFLLETFRQRYDEFKMERCSVEALTRSARQLQDARLELAATVDKQIEIRKEYLAFTKEIEGVCEIHALPCAGYLPRLSMEDYKLAQVARLDAEIDLLRAQRKAQPSATK